MTQDQDAPHPRSKCATVRGINLTTLHQLQICPGHILSIEVQNAGTTPGFIHDSRTLRDSNSFTRIADIPNRVGAIEIDQRIDKGLVVQLGAGQIVLVSYL